MTFTIHSIGDSAFLEQILIAVSMVTSSGSFARMISIGLLVSSLVVCVKSLFNNCERIDYQQLLIGWLIYSCLFVPTTRVTIENNYTGEVSVIDHVPIGLGAAGGIISTIGYGITRLFETGFTVIAPGITKGTAFAESLSLLNDVRRFTYNTAVFNALDKSRGPQHVNSHLSWHNYIRECTLTKIDIHETALTQLFHQPINRALKFKSQLYTTLLKTAPGRQQGEQLNCTDAYQQLMATTKLDHPEVTKTLGRVLGFNKNAQPDTFGHITNALQAVGAGSTAATDFVRVALLEPLYYEAAAGRHQDFQDYNSALMVNQAIQQRNVKWAAEQTMFMTLVRPMITFFEGFIYAITPLMAFMIMMGSLGFQLLGKYVQTLFWIQLWMPVMSIINLFIHTASTRAIAPLANSSAGLSSMYALNATEDILQHWIATGGMLAAATPVISLFIVSGSTHAISGLIGRMSSSDTLDPKIASPDAVRTAPILGASPVYSQDASGMIATGSALPQITLGSMLSQGMSATTTRMQQASQTFQQTLGHNLTEGVSQEQSYARMADIGRSVSSQNTSASQFVNEQAKNLMQKFGISDKHTDAVKGILSTYVGGSLNATATASKLNETRNKKDDNDNSNISKIASKSKCSGVSASLGVGAKGFAEKNSTDETSRTAEDISQYIQSVKFTETQTQQLTNQLAQGFSEQSRQGFKETWGDTLSKNLSDSASEVTSVAQSHSEIQQSQKNAGTILNTDVKKLAGVINQDSGAYNDLNKYFSGHATSKTRQEAADINDCYQRFGMNPEIADTASKLTALFNTGNHTPEKALAASKAASRAILRAYGLHPALNTEHQSNELMTHNLADRVKEGIGIGPNKSYDRNQIQIQANTPLSPDDSAVQQHNQQNLGSSQQHGQEMVKNLSKPAEDKARSDLLHFLPEQSWASSIFGSMNNSKDWLYRRRDHLGDALFSGSRESSHTFNHAMEQLRTLTPEQREQFITATKNGDRKLQQTAGGKLASAAIKLGNNFIGAAVTGYDQAQKWLSGKSDLSEAAKTMTLEERGAYYTAAFTAAASAGVKETVRFMDEYGSEFKQTLAASAEQRYGVTPAQAAVYAESFDTNQDRMAAAVRNLKMEYAEVGPDGKALFNNQGDPILNSKNEKFTDQLVNVLQNASTAGDRSGSYLTGISRYNIANKKFR